MGIATHRTDERILCALGLGSSAPVQFEHSEAVCNAGVLFLLPALLSQGLLKTKDFYTFPDNHYYNVQHVVLTLAIMALARIKNPEQLKQCKPGEIGKIIGLDRIPEVSCLREKLKFLSAQNKAQQLNNELIDHWQAESEEPVHYLYIDGHVRVYHGDSAKLTNKFVSRQKLCLSATTEFWVNDTNGMPIMVSTGELNEKLQDAIEHQILPQLQQTHLLPKLQSEQSLPRLTLVFDREAYDIPFFTRLWTNHQIAIITYRKNVKDTWDENGFTSHDVVVGNNTITMQLCEKEIVLNGEPFTEVRRLMQSKHQTSVLTNNKHINVAKIAGMMFSRWAQENFFRYMKMDYDFDKMIEYGSVPLDENSEIVNPAYRILTNQLKKEKEKMRRVEAVQYELNEKFDNETIEKTPYYINRQSTLEEKRKAHQQLTQSYEEKKKDMPKRIKLAEMSEEKRFTKLKPESKLFMNIIKMICYRAETIVANLLSPYLKNTSEEKRMLIKQIIETNADIIPDEENKTLTIILHSLSTPRFNNAANELAKVLTQTETIFPDTDLKIIFKITAPVTAKDKEV